MGTVTDVDWRGTRWAHEPHIRFGDPCFNCGTPMTPASRRWSSFTIPKGYRKHAGNALCSSCRNTRAREAGEADPGMVLVLLAFIVVVLVGAGGVALIGAAT